MKQFTLFFLLLLLNVSVFADSVGDPPSVDGSNILPEMTSPGGSSGSGTRLNSLLGQTSYNAEPGVDVVKPWMNLCNGCHLGGDGDKSGLDWYMRIEVRDNGDVYLFNTRHSHTVTLCSNTTQFLGNIVNNPSGFFRTKIPRCNLASRSSRTHGFEFFIHREGVYVNSHENKYDKANFESFLHWRAK